MRAHRAAMIAIGVIVAAACSKGSSGPAAFTEPPFTPEVTLAPSATPAGAGTSSNQLQIQPLAGQTIVLHVAGFQSGETVTFTITKPDGTSFTGPPHVVGQDGTVEARYSPPVAGTYTVLAKGDKSDQANLQFTVSGGPAGGTSAPGATSRPRVRHTATPAPTHHVTPTPHATATPH